MITNIYIFGASGYIGSTLKKRLLNENLKVFSVGRSGSDDIKINLSAPDFNELNSIKEDSICIFLSSISSPEVCYKKFKESYEINVTNSSDVISFLLNKNIKVLFASSDVVYGDQGKIVNELSPINPKTPYAEMKALVEDKFIKNKNFFIMRLSYVWSINDNFSKFLISSSRENIKIDIYEPFIRSIVSLEDVIDFIKRFIELQANIPNLVNIAGPNFISRVELVEEFRKYMPIKYFITKPNKSFLETRPMEILMESLYLKNVLERNTFIIYNLIKKNLLQLQGIKSE